MAAATAPQPCSPSNFTRATMSRDSCYCTRIMANTRRCWRALKHRAERRRSVWRHQASRLMNWLRERITHIRLTDHGCMLRGYSRRIVNRMNAYGETNIFIPALGYTFAQNPAEIEVAHDKRFAGDSKYSFYALIR